MQVKNAMRKVSCQTRGTADFLKFWSWKLTKSINTIDAGKIPPFFDLCKQKAIWSKDSIPSDDCKFNELNTLREFIFFLRELK